VDNGGVRDDIPDFDPEVTDRRRRAAEAGHRGDESTARQLLADEAATVRATALGALARLGKLERDDLVAALGDVDPGVRRRAAVEARHDPTIDLVPLLDDAATLVAEAAAWALGERGDPEHRSSAPPESVVRALASMATGHADPLCREAAVAALGAIGDPGGLAAILAATKDKPAVRRRAVLALAPFEGPDVDAALARALTDRDWQVRQAAEDLSDPG